MSGWIKLILMVSMMTFGFFLVYALAWVLMGFELTGRTTSGLLFLAMVSEIGYYFWVRA